MDGDSGVDTTAAAAAGPDVVEDLTGPTADDRRQHERRRSRHERWRLRTALPIALGVAAGLLLSNAVLAVTQRLRGIFTLLLLSLFLSFAIEPAVLFLSKRGVRRGIGTAFVYVLALALGAVFVWAFSGLVTAQAGALADAAPTLLDDIADQAGRLPDDLEAPVRDFLEQQSDEFAARASELVGDVGRRALGLGSSVIGVVFSTLTVALITFYLVADGPRLRRQLLMRLEPHRQRELAQLWDLAIAKTGGYVYSRIVLAVVSAGVHIVAFTLLDLPYAAALGVWMGLVSSVVPVIGLYLALVVPVVVALAEPGVSVVWIVVVVTAYQQLENYVVQPRITAHTLSLHPAVAFVAVLVGAALLGAVGALLALPAAAIVAALISTYADVHEVVEDGTPDPGDAPATA